MILDFNKLEATAMHNFKGGEKDMLAKMYLDDLNRIMVSRLEPGASIGYHLHDKGSEIIFVLEGTGTATYDGKEEIVKPGMCQYCPKGHSHGLANRSDEELVFFAVVPAQ
jgi:quercetin dioxygenase-like cupin family protein